MDLSLRKILLIIVSLAFVAALLLLAYNESAKMRQVLGGKAITVHTDATSKQCIDCHERKAVAPGVIEQWKLSKHMEQGIGCVECHKAQEGDWDAFTCPESNLLVARHPTPKDCQECHEDEVKEFAESKHAHQYWIYANADRAVFEPAVATKNGCEQCHNISNLWPDGSVGECDACHAKHSFSLAVARQPETCGECHIGPDHPHIEIYNESKHGNIFAAKGHKWDLNYTTDEKTPIPIEAPVCTTCHMDGAPGVPATHNVSARLAWESQAAWSSRTVWFEEKLGDWQAKRKQMSSICYNCHAKDFVEDYFLAADLANLQYNEIRRAALYWLNRYHEQGLLSRLELDGKFYDLFGVNGWDEEPERLVYYGWHHEGRRFRHGAEMMGADYTQWHGIWELQQGLVELIEWGAEHGDPEATAWVKSKSPTKFFPYKILDMLGNPWGINTESQKTPVLYKLVPNYWEKVKANVEAVFKHGLLSKEQWERWLERYENKDYYLGTKFPEHPIFKEYKARKDVDDKATKEQIIDLALPSPAPYEEIK